MALALGDPEARERGQERIGEVLEQVGLGEHVDTLPSRLSGGQKQRVGSARALVNRPRIILADEPTASLDKKSGRDVVQLIWRLSREEGATVILVTHDNRILDAADRILHLEDGRIQSPRSRLSNPNPAASTAPSVDSRLLIAVGIIAQLASARPGRAR